MRFRVRWRGAGWGGEFAGVGVVDGSDPASELAETQFKLQALLAAVVRP